MPIPLPDDCFEEEDSAFPEGVPMPFADIHACRYILGGLYSPSA